ncbi:MAG: hypothetical protein K8R53_15050 [Bacteroidales bacterium]|nr:hypothetical protein [Bacteroidales bacterium]
MDFTVKKYRELLISIVNAGFNFQTFEDYLANPKEKTVILRHDVDKKPKNSLLFAQIQSKMSIRGSYYFRIVRQSYDEAIIREIASLGHEIGYHYEEMDLVRGDIEAAIELFRTNLKKLRNFYPVKTICMHGSPLSKYDNKTIWKKYDYHNFGITGEPYFDLDFNKMLYLTDTGRRWNGEKVSVRDKVHGNFNYNLRTTDEIIGILGLDSFPEKVMFVFHPQRWDDNTIAWIKELFIQNSKNLIKKYFFVKKE